MPPPPFIKESPLCDRDVCDKKARQKHRCDELNANRKEIIHSDDSDQSDDLDGFEQVALNMPISVMSAMTDDSKSCHGFSLLLISSRCCASSSDQCVLELNKQIAQREEVTIHDGD